MIVLNVIQKQSSKQTLPRDSSDAAVIDEIYKNSVFIENIGWLLFSA